MIQFSSTGSLISSKIYPPIMDEQWPCPDCGEIEYAECSYFRNKRDRWNHILQADVELPHRVEDIYSKIVELVTKQSKKSFSDGIVLIQETQEKIEVERELNKKDRGLEMLEGDLYSMKRNFSIEKKVLDYFSTNPYSELLFRQFIVEEDMWWNIRCSVRELVENPWLYPDRIHGRMEEESGNLQWIIFTPKEMVSYRKKLIPTIEQMNRIVEQLLIEFDSVFIPKTNSLKELEDSLIKMNIIHPDRINDLYEYLESVFDPTVQPRSTVSREMLGIAYLLQDRNENAREFFDKYSHRLG